MIEWRHGQKQSRWGFAKELYNGPASLVMSMRRGLRGDSGALRVEGRRCIGWGSLGEPIMSGMGMVRPVAELLHPPSGQAFVPLPARSSHPTTPESPNHGIPAPPRNAHSGPPALERCAGDCGEGWRPR